MATSRAGRSCRLGAAVIKSAVVLGAIEVTVRVLAGVGLLSVPPAYIHGFDRFFGGAEASEHRRLYQPDRDLISRLRSNADLTYDRSVVYSGGRSTYRVQTNDRGFRTPPFSERKRAGVFRIICLGDSSTFGLNVEAADTYPLALGRMLEERYPGRFEVINLAVPGYSSRQGIELLRKEALRYEPDLVTFAFGTNDRFWKNTLTDDELITLSQTPLGGVLIGLRTALDHVYTYRVLKRMLEPVIRGRSRSPGATPDARLRVSLDEIRDAIISAQRELSGVGARLVVLNNDFLGTDARQGITAGVAATGVPFLNAQKLFVEKEYGRTREIEGQYRLPAAQGTEKGTLFRVITPEKQEAVVVEYGYWLSPMSRLPMRDDGLEGDQVAGDGIWSAVLPVRQGAVSYRYWNQVDGELRKEFRYTTFMEYSRKQGVDASGVGAIDRFGTYYLHSDTSHPDEEGHAVIARELMPIVVHAAGAASASRVTSPSPSEPGSRRAQSRSE